MDNYNNQIQSVDIFSDDSNDESETSTTDNNNLIKEFNKLKCEYNKLLDEYEDLENERDHYLITLEKVLAENRMLKEERNNN